MKQILMCIKHLIFIKFSMICHRFEFAAIKIVFLLDSHVGKWKINPFSLQLNCCHFISQNKSHSQILKKAGESLDVEGPSSSRKFMRSRVTSSLPNFSDSRPIVHSAMSFYGN